jgi:hypothetical protein
MKKTVLWFLAIAIVSAAGFLPFKGTDVSKLQPVEVLVLQYKEGLYTISGEDGLIGYGEDVLSALEDLKATASGEVFLETANYLLISEDCLACIEELSDFLRPACQLYQLEGEGVLASIAKYLENHPSDITLLSYKQNMSQIPRLIVQGEVYRIVRE